MDLVARGIRTVAATVAMSVVVVAALAASAEAPDRVPSGDHRAAAQGHHATAPPAEPAAAAVRRGAKVATHSRALPKIRGTVGPGYTITISRHRVVPGRYRVVVTDASSAHNWHITGPRVDRSTSVAGTGKSVWRVRLRPGRYTIVCDPHPTTMKTSLRVTAD